MPVWISMLRGVNVGPHNRIKMDALRRVYESLKLENARTYVQSGNVIFRSRQQNAAALAKKIQSAIDVEFGFCPEVILRRSEELQQAIAANPFAGRSDVEPDKLLVTFLADEPAPEAKAALSSLKYHPEELHLIGRELYIYFPNGAGQSKLSWSTMGKLLRSPGTARNLNTVIKMAGIAEEVDRA